jgi:hypothetical protein
VCYFGGGAEIAYFAQNSEAYRILDRPVTHIFHRQSLTIVEPKQRKTLDKLNLSLPDLCSGVEATMLRLSDNVSPDAARLFADVEESINGELHKLDQFLAAADPTLPPIWESGVRSFTISLPCARKHYCRRSAGMKRRISRYGRVLIVATNGQPRTPHQRNNTSK